MTTNELRILDVEKVRNMRQIKPRINPLHERFIDSWENVFSKFSIKNKHYHCKGGNNIIYINNNFTLRISKRYLKTEEEELDKEKHLDIPTKKLDEHIAIKAVKYKISPHIYFMGNIFWNSKVHRYTIIESYEMTLSYFFYKKKYEELVKNSDCYKNVDDLYDDINCQFIDIIDTITKMGYIYYDFKPDNIVINIKDGRIVLKVIDWDSDFCVCEPWMFQDDNENQENINKGIRFMNLLLLSFSLYSQHNNNILYKTIQNLFSQTIFENIYYILLETENLYVQIIIHYFYKLFDMTLQEKENFYNIERKEQDRQIFQMMLHLIRTCHKQNKQDTSDIQEIKFTEYQSRLIM